MKDTIYSINGPVVTVRDTDSFGMMEMVYVGNAGLIGEVIHVSDDRTTIQVYENTTGLSVGEPVKGTGAPLSATLGPGIMENIFDGIERPLGEIAEKNGAFIATGVHVSSLDETRKWDVTVTVKPGASVRGGDVIATCPETSIITHKSMVPPDVSGTVIWAAEDGAYTVTDPICKVKTPEGEEKTLCLAQRWPIRVPRPVQDREVIGRPLITGQRVIDTLFPIAKGGVAAIPGGFGTGKTMTQHQLAKWCDADIIIYVGCGERGNEMTQVLNEFRELEDPKSGKPMTQRTVLIANTSNMPVAAREASIYTGITLAEYYRDMGYDVAMMADSTSRWAEALREMSGRLEEMPGEEGYPAYLASRLAQFYERAGVVECMGGDSRQGSVTAIGAVSPPGGDISEPVSQATMRIVKVFWALDSSLAYARHFPAINWLTSYSLYLDSLAPWYTEQFGDSYMANRDKAMHILQEESELQEIVRLVGQDALSPADRLTMETAKMIREDFLQQNAFVDEDAYSSYAKQFRLLDLILHYDVLCREALEKGADMNGLFAIDAREKIGRAKMADAATFSADYDAIDAQMKEEIANVIAGGEDA